MSKSLLSHFTKKWRKWFDLFHEQIAFANKKGLICYFKKIYFPYAFDSFSQLSPFFTQKQIAPIALYKRVTITHYKRAMWPICSFSWVNAFFLFRWQMMSNLHKKPMSKFSTLQKWSQSADKVWWFNLKTNWAIMLTQIKPAPFGTLITLGVVPLCCTPVVPFVSFPTNFLETSAISETLYIFYTHLQ